MGTPQPPSGMPGFRYPQWGIGDEGAGESRGQRSYTDRNRAAGHAPGASSTNIKAPSFAEQEDLRFEEAIRSFGFVSGAAYQCLPEADRAAHDREVLKAFSGLVRVFGSDRAFFYAASFDAGTSMSLDKAKCAVYIEDFKAAIKSSVRGQ